MNPEWLALDKAHAWHPYTQHALDPEPLAVVGAQGAWLECADGRRLLDAISSWWSILHGHGHPRIVAAIQEQAARLDHVLFAGCTHEPAARLAASLVECAAVLPEMEAAALGSAGPPLTRVFYSDSGATSVEVALKAAYLSHLRRGEKGRRVFITLENSYHGDTVGAMSVGDPAPFFADFAPLLFEVERVAVDADALAAVLQRRGEEVAALIVEPLVQGAAGMVMHSPEFLQKARLLCRNHGVFLIADEVATGFGRTGTLFACEQAGITPDFLCLAKGLSGGVLPLAATMTSEVIYEDFLSNDRARTFFHGHTFTANPIACAAGCASMEIIREENTPAKLARNGERIESGLRDFSATSAVKDLRRLGGIVAMELAVEDQGYFATLGDSLRHACRQTNVLLRPSGNVLYAIPPSCTTPEECDLIAQTMVEVAEISSLPQQA